MKINDRFWLVLNKREPSKLAYYLTIFFSGFVTAIVLILGIIALQGSWIAGFAIFICAVLAAVWSICDDNRRGYIRALHVKNVELWKERRKRLGVK